MMMMNTIHRHHHVMSSCLTTLWLIWASTCTTCEGRGRAYGEWSLQKIHAKLHEWEQLYPDFVTLTTAQDAYGLPRAGGPEDCPFDEGADGCLNYILTVQDKLTHPVGSRSAKHLPAVMLSGALHGDERVGPTVVMETVGLLLEAASCESKLLTDPKTAAEGHSCRQALEQDEFINGQQR